MRIFIDVMISLFAFVAGIHTLLTGEIETKTGMIVDGGMAILGGIIMISIPFVLGYKYWSQMHSQKKNGEDEE